MLIDPNEHPKSISLSGGCILSKMFSIGIFLNITDNEKVKQKCFFFSIIHCFYFCFGVSLFETTFCHLRGTLNTRMALDESTVDEFSQ